MAVTTPGETADETSAARHTRRARARTAAAAHGVPLATIIVSAAVVSATYLAGKLIYRLRGIVLLMVTAGFWVTRNAPKLQTLGSSLAKPALTFGKGAVSLLAELGTIAALVVLFLLEGPKVRTAVLSLLPPERSERYARVAGEINRSVTGYALGNLLTSLIAGLVVFVTLAALGVPFPLLWALWVALVDFLPMIGGALAGIPTVLFALGHSFTAGLVTLIVFLTYMQVENHILNPVVMSRTTKVNPLLVLVSILVGTSTGEWIGGTFGAFVAALVAIPLAGALQITVRELWQATA
jgi:predicted PurR-regulated permease PerM